MTCCNRCGVFLPENQKLATTCAKCLISPPIFHSCHAIFRYESPIKEIISAFKFNGCFAEGQVLGKYLSRQFNNYYSSLAPPELLIPIPLHANRLRQRGFNQATELTRIVSRYSQIKMSLKDIIRHLNTRPQAELKADERKQNMNNAFVLRATSRIAQVNHVAVIDDVVTTMSTSAAVANLLIKAGVKKVDIWSIARTHNY